MYVVRENKSLINAKKSLVTSMSVIKQIERRKRKTKLGNLKCLLIVNFFFKYLKRPKEK